VIGNDIQFLVFSFGVYFNTEGHRGFTEVCQRQATLTRRRMSGGEFEVLSRDEFEDALAEPLPGRIAEQALADFVYRRASFLLPRQVGDYSIVEDWIGVNELIEVQGIDGLLELSRIYGRRLLVNPDDWVMDDLQIFTEKPTEIVRVFEEYAVREESIAVYYHYLIYRQVFMTDEERKSARQSSLRQKISIETILNAARNKEGEYPSIYMTFGVRATATELETVFDLLLTEADEDICLRLLWIFRHTPLPRLADRLFDWADSSYGKLRMAAVEVLARISDDRVYRLGRSKHLFSFIHHNADINTLLKML
jgi:hypothetical protein